MLGIVEDPHSHNRWEIAILLMLLLALVLIAALIRQILPSASVLRHRTVRFVQTSVWMDLLEGFSAEENMYDALLRYVSRQRLCHHTRTPVHEGKCYCPDCGRGLIYQWIVLRCNACKTRRDSVYRFRRIVPQQRCCPQCGENTWRVERLDSPLYYQLHKARLRVQLVDDAVPRQPFHWSHYQFEKMERPSQTPVNPSRRRLTASLSS